MVSEQILFIFFLILISISLMASSSSSSMESLSSSSTNIFVDSSNPFYLHHSDNPGSNLVSQLLVEDNSNTPHCLGVEKRDVYLYGICFL